MLNYVTITVGAIYVKKVEIPELLIMTKEKRGYIVLVPNDARVAKFRVLPSIPYLNSRRISSATISYLFFGITT